ncbi:hypothetical protein SNOG_12638 [Parastagonospora nodorum SN15]|uniref:Uncharacterized protein n=1 Tax=Phaeosphaeria nodorum (strain SN15 / ATCC MYA-4574 / FGSC 10173) TaxID=321614 RepID=Q0U6H6_PHANO|nr:hypothetical protein SNOG_12638 [Parastagonospora nodorum SN15]EAT79936.1 hypothetical protein SNOG_12638 [Parastagonospora nodorum SN15]
MTKVKPCWLENACQTRDHTNHLRAEYLTEGSVFSAISSFFFLKVEDNPPSTSAELKPLATKTIAKLREECSRKTIAKIAQDLVSDLPSLEEDSGEEAY